MAQQIFERLQTHLRHLREQPTTLNVNEQLVAEAQLVLPDQLDQAALLSVVQDTASTLQTIQQDPSVLISLLQKLVRPFSFTNVLSFNPPIDFVSGLGIADHLVPINALMLDLLQKATSPADVATIASRPEVVLTLIHLWLRTPAIGIANQASQTLLQLLKIDHPEASHSAGQGQGQGLMWKRLFSDQDVYGALYADCDIKASTSGKQQTTLAQARLLEVLPELAALDWSAVSSSHQTGIEAQHDTPEGGLLSFAALNMVDYEDDILTHCVLIDFYTQLLVRTRTSTIMTTGVQSGFGLDFLLATKIHERVSGIYLQSSSNADSIEAMFLYGPAANYLATYTSLYPRHYMASKLPTAIKTRLMNAFGISAARWAHAESPKHDLHLLASLPKTSLLPNTGNWSDTALSLLPSRATNPDVLNTLATIFHGPSQEAITFPQASPMTDEDHDAKLEDSAAARALYLHYVAHNQQFWKDIAQHADTVALLDLALAAINVLTAVITANWSSKPESAVPSSIIATPTEGHLAILSPPALEYALPYLMKPPQTFSNLVGGRGDAESAAYKIAMAKYDALQAFQRKLAAHVDADSASGLEDVLATISKRLAEGPMSRSGEVGGRIATLEL